MHTHICSVRGVRRRSAGLTLLELVVVLTILVALGGIALAMVPNMLGRSHYAACSTNIPELAKAIEQYQALRGSFPDRFDSLRTSEGALVSYLPSMTSGTMTSTFVANALETTPTLTAGDVAALSAAGISNVVSMTEKPAASASPGDWSASIWPYSTSRATVPTATPITIGNLNQLKANLATTILGQENDADCRYVIFGIGSQCSMVGVTVHEAPCAFVANMSQSINDLYYRYGAVFKVADNTGAALSRAKFVGVVMLSPKGIRNAEQHISAWYTTNSDEAK